MATSTFPNTLAFFNPELDKTVQSLSDPSSEVWISHTTNVATPFFDLGPDFASGYGLINESVAITAAVFNTPVFV
ncbi:MAG: hypothetical protein AAGD25_03560 [Cyanobacteria bacterium P01_F01_bin.150]